MSSDSNPVEMRFDVAEDMFRTERSSTYCTFH